MKIITTFSIMTTSLLMSYGSMATSQDYQQAMAELKINALEFIEAAGYETVDPDSLTDASYYSQENFPSDPNEASSIGLADAELDPITRAMLLFETQEVNLPHSRYRITYSTNTSTEVPEAQHDYVEVTRYNIGPSRRNELLESIPQDQVADLEEFGVGPHISWRFAMSPVMGMQSGLMHASRKELTDAEAQATDCLGEPCLGLTDPSGPELDWQTIQSPQLVEPIYNKKTELIIARPTRIIQEIWASMAPDGIEPLPYIKEQAPFVFVVSWNTSGQEIFASALAHESQVMDDSVAAVWTRRDEVAQMPTEFSRAYVYRR